MLRGRFGDTSKRPYLEGRLFIPRLEVQADISFLVDTGADKTTLSPGDGLRMGLDYEALIGNTTPSVGIGGISHNYTEQAAAVFNDPGKVLYMYEIDLEIVEPNDSLIDIPSLLGRDILNNWRMRYSPPTKRLTFNVVHADRIIQLDAPSPSPW